MCADERLVERVVGHDVAAFELLYRKHYDRLVALVARMTRRAEVAEEVADEAMLVLWRKPQSFRGASRVSTWLCGIAYRLALKRLTRARRQPDLVDLEAVELVDPLSPERVASATERHRLLMRAMAELPPAQLAVVELTFVHGCGYQEIAELLDCPVGTVKTRMFHARLRLKRVLGDGGAEGEDG